MRLAAANGKGKNGQKKGRIYFSHPNVRRVGIKNKSSPFLCAHFYEYKNRSITE
jgi:hypothetical protein